MTIQWRAQALGDSSQQLDFVVMLFAVGLAIALLIFLWQFAGLWFQARMGGVAVSLLDLVGMRLRRMDARHVILSAIRAKKLGLDLQVYDLERHAAVRDLLEFVDSGDYALQLESATPGRVVISATDRDGNTWEAQADSQSAAIVELARTLGLDDGD